MECKKCQYQNKNNATFCGNCGNKLVFPIEKNNYNHKVIKISIFFFTLLIYLSSAHFIEFEGNYKNFIAFDLFLAFIILIFYFIDAKKINKLLKYKNLDKRLILKIIIIAPLFAILVSFIIFLLKQSSLEIYNVIFYEKFIHSPAPFLFTLISIGFLPAIFEEIAFRGIIFNELSEITGLKPTIIITSILFTILHLSLLSILWIFPIGIVFGYFRARYRTIWYGIIGHFTYNCSIAIIQIITLI